MIKKIIFILLLIPYFASAEVKVSDIKIKPALLSGYSTTIYFTLENTGDQLDYLVQIKLIDFPHNQISINKTIIEKHIARIIKIDRLSIPPHTKINSQSLKIYAVAEDLPVNLSAINLKFIFANNKN